MITRVNRVEFLAEISPMKGVIERRTTIPILSHVLLRATEDRLELAATDLEVSLTSRCAAEVEEEGAVAVRALKLAEIIRASEGEEVAFEVKNETLHIAVGKSRFRLRGLPAEDFPTLPQMGEEDAVTMSFSTFRSMIGKVFFAIPAEDARFQIAGAMLKPLDRGLAMVATDGHRLALVEVELDGLEEADGVLVPRKALKELQRFDSPLDLEFRQTDHHLSFTLGERQLICRRLEGSFPDYERVVAKDNDKVVVVERELLAHVVARVGLMTGDRSRAVKLELQPDALVFSSSNPDLGEATEEVAIEYDGDALAVGANPDYLAHFLSSAATDLVRLELKDENSQCVAYPVEGPDKRHLCVIMPIRL